MRRGALGIATIPRATHDFTDRHAITGHNLGADVRKMRSVVTHTVVAYDGNGKSTAVCAQICLPGEAIYAIDFIHYA